MSRSTRRIVLLGALLGAGALVVLAALAHTMLLEHALWLERSYRNRWAFRDVPTRRGSICDRTGRELVRDRACFALDLDHDAFRRTHPVGLALGAAAMLWPGELRHRPADIEEAGRRILALPVRELQAERHDRAYAKDLRFYAVGLVGVLTGRPRAQVGRVLLDVLAAEHRDRPLAEALAVDPATLLAALRASTARLHQLADVLHESGGERDLFALLDRQLARHVAERKPLAARPVARRLPFHAAAQLFAEREAWSGFVLRPSVTRESTLDLPSLRAVLGRVTAAGADEDDPQRIAELSAQWLDEAQLLESLPNDIDLPDEALARLTERAQNYLRYRVLQGGRFGRNGIEGLLEDRLAGQPGLRFVERDVRAREHLLYHTLDVDPGDDVRVTIDARLQRVLEDVLDAHQRGIDVAMAVIDAWTGDVLALGGRPLETEGPDGKPIPRAVSPAVTWRNAGHVGSLAKPFVLLEQLAAERAGTAAAAHDTFVGCARIYKRLRGTPRPLACDGYHGEEGRDPAAAIAKSCNVFFFQAAEALGMDGLRRAYARAGWVELPADGGEVPLYQATVRGVPGFSRPRLEPGGHAMQHVGIGYGVKANALSVARAYAGLATGRLPTLGVVAGETRPVLDLGIPAADLAVVHAGLRRCVLDGTARDVPGLAEVGVHGKTGTAEVNERDENNAWFAGFVCAPDGRPTLAFAAVAYTVSDHGKESARMVADFLHGIATLPDPEPARRWLQGVEER